MSNFFAIPITDEWGTTYQLTTAGYTALVVLMLALLLLACFIGNSVKQPKFSARQLAFSAMAIAAAFVTSEIFVTGCRSSGKISSAFAFSIVIPCPRSFGRRYSGFLFTV